MIPMVETTRLELLEYDNIGAPGENYRVRQIAEIARDVVPNSEVRFADGASANTRCYRVNFDKAFETLRYYRPQWTARKGAEECYTAYKKYAVTLEEFEGPKYQRLAHIHMLIHQGIIADDLRFKRDRVFRNPQSAIRI